ncbi:MAG: FapA family protein [Planctomycetota bacterium]
MIAVDAFQLVVAPDKRQATLTVAPGTPADTPTLAAVIHRAHDLGLVNDEHLQREAAGLLTRASTSDQPVAGVLAEAVEPIPGEPGRVEWTVQAAAQAQTCDQADQASHYDRSNFITVTAGQVLGKLYRPTDGTPGKDLFGELIPAKAGKPCPCEIDSNSIGVSPSGEMTSLFDGVLSQKTTSAKVSRVLEISEDVDFSTGNLDFDGDINIRGGIKDCFVIRSGQSVTVQGLVEAATIHARDNLEAAGGIAGRERAELLVGGDLKARYLDNVNAQVGGTLFLDKEAINSTIVTHGLEGPRAALIGGRTTLVGPGQIDTLGSEAGVSTEIILASVPRLDAYHEQLKGLVDELRREQRRLEKRIHELQNKPSLSPDEANELRDGQKRLKDLGKAMFKAEPRVEELAKEIADQKALDLRVMGIVYPGTRLIFGQAAYTFAKSFQGPLHVFEEDGQTMVHIERESRPRLLASMTTLEAFRE